MYRSATGLIFADNFDRADGDPGADYAQVTSTTRAIVSNKLRITGAGAEGHTRIVGAGRMISSYQQALVTRIGAGTDCGFVQQANSSENHYIAQLVSANAQLYRRGTGGSYTLLDDEAYAPGTTEHLMQVHRAPSIYKMWIDGTLRGESVDNVFTTAGYNGIRNSASGQSIDVDNLIICSSPIVTVSGIPTGFSAQLKDSADAVVVGPTAEAAGTVAFDTSGLEMPFGALEVLNENGDVVDYLEIEVYGGDTFTYSEKLRRPVEGLLKLITFDTDALGSPPPGWTASLPSGTQTFNVQNAPGGLMTGRALQHVAVTTGDALFTRDRVSDLVADQVVQSVVRLVGTAGSNNNQPCVVARRSSSFVFAMIRGFDGGPPAFRLFSPGSTDQIAAMTVDRGVDYQVRLRIRSDVPEARLYDAAGVQLQVLTAPNPTTETGLKVGVYGVGAGTNNAWFDNYAIYRETRVSVTSLPSGYKARLGTQAAVEAAGTATLDYTGLFPVATLEILNAADAVVASITPTGGVWGGDTWEFTGAFVAPAQDEEISGEYGVAFTEVPGAALHQLELSVDGGASWSVLDDNIVTAPVNGLVIWPWDTIAIAAAAGVQLRARGDAGDWFYSGTFSIQNIPFETIPPVRKAWAFTMDGHVFYVIGSFDDATLLYDGTSGQWCRWMTEGYAFWNMHRGVMWRGRVLAADRVDPVIWELDPSTLLDQEALEITRAVTGFQAVRGDNSFRQGSLRMVARQQTGVAVDAVITLRFSDDGGNTWSQPRTLELATATARLEFRSLGRLRKPGRIWEITDNGGLIRISGLNSVMDGA